MAWPDYSAYISQLWGWPEETDCGVAVSAANATNFVFGTNPPYGVGDFLSFYPKFGSYSGSPPIYNGPVPVPVLQAYVNLASACLVQARWLEVWPAAMAWFVAHFVTLYLASEGNAGSTPGAIARSGLGLGVIVSQSAGDVSKSVEPPDLGEFAGALGMTIYGQQLATAMRVMGAGPALIY
jgi:hypothetical protein